MARLDIILVDVESGQQLAEPLTLTHEQLPIRTSMQKLQERIGELFRAVNLPVVFQQSQTQLQAFLDGRQARITVAVSSKQPAIDCKQFYAVCCGNCPGKRQLTDLETALKNLGGELHLPARTNAQLVIGDAISKFRDLERKSENDKRASREATAARERTHEGLIAERDKTIRDRDATITNLQGELRVLNDRISQLEARLEREAKRSLDEKARADDLQKQVNILTRARPQG